MEAAGVHIATAIHAALDSGEHYLVSELARVNSTLNDWLESDARQAARRASDALASTDTASGGSITVPVGGVPLTMTTPEEAAALSGSGAPTSATPSPFAATVVPPNENTTTHEDPAPPSDGAGADATPAGPEHPAS